jgi:glycosyltransferase involved in cell wall biosynthesis
MGEGWLTERLAQLGIPYQRLPKQAVAASRALEERIRSESHDLLIHAHGPRANVVAWRVASRTGRPWVSTIHSDPRWDFAGQRVKRILFTHINRWALRHASGLFGVSPQFSALFPGQPFQTVPNAVWLEPLPNEAAFYAAELRRQLHVPPDTFVVGTVARLEPVKDIPTLIRAAALLREEPVHWVIAGDGRQRPELEAMIRELGLEHVVSLLGYVTATSSLYAGLSAHALVSRSEGTGLSLLEAGFFGVPNIGSDIPGITQLIKHGETGLIVPVGDPAAVADAVKRLRTDPGLGSRLAERFRRETLTRYQPDRMLEAYIEGYERWLERGRGRS